MKIALQVSTRNIMWLVAPQIPTVSPARTSYPAVWGYQMGTIHSPPGCGNQTISHATTTELFCQLRNVRRGTSIHCTRTARRRSTAVCAGVLLKLQLIVIVIQMLRIVASQEITHKLKLLCTLQM